MFQRKRKEKVRAAAGRSGIRGKIQRILWISVIPMAALAVFSILAINSFYRQYDQSVRNITEINAYNTGFEEEMNRSMYYIIVESYDWDALKDTDDERNPYVQIEAFQSSLGTIRSHTTDVAILNDIEAIGRMLNSLKKRVDDIIANVEEGGHYDENMEMLSSNINVLTDLIQTDIDDYIYLEAANMQAIQKEISHRVQITIITLIAGVAALLVLILMISAKFSGKITDPIRDMCRKTEQFAGGDFSVRFDCRTGDEIETLSDSFNSMVTEISGLVDDIKREQKNSRDAELRLLQEQINPHFLYNTLDAIMWLIESGQNGQAVSMVSSLSDFFRTTLSKGRDWITVGEEKSHVRSYLEIQRFRYTDILDYTIRFSPEIEHYYVMKLMLQPIVENAIYHGIKNKRGKGMVTVTGCPDGEDLVFTVRDDGIGMTEEELGRMRELISGQRRDDSQHGFGIANVEQRIRLNYGAGYGISVESAYGEGSLVTVRIPKVVRPPEE